MQLEEQPPSHVGLEECLKKPGFEYAITRSLNRKTVYIPDYHFNSSQDLEHKEKDDMENKNFYIF